MTLLTLVRHGQTDWNLQQRIQGSSDIPLNATGEEQARLAAKTLPNARYDGVYSSHLSRAHRTAQIIAEELGLDAPGIVPGLQERSYGEAEGRNAGEFLAEHKSWDAPVPGSEPREEVLERALTALDLISRDARRRSAPRMESLIVVSHGGVIWALLAHASGGTLPPEGHRLENGSAHRFRVDRSGLHLLDLEPNSVPR